jgi:WG containing repeat
MQKASASWLVCLILLMFCAATPAQQGESKDRFMFWENNLTGFLDRSGQVVIKAQFSSAQDFHEGLAYALLNDPSSGRTQSGYIDRAGEMIIKLPPNSIGRRFSEGLAAVTLNNQLGYIDKTGKLVIEGKFQEMSDFSDGMARVKMYDKLTFIDKTGKILVDPIFDDAENFSGGLARVRVGSRWGYIDKQGKYVWRMK